MPFSAVQQWKPAQRSFVTAKAEQQEIFTSTSALDPTKSLAHVAASEGDTALSSARHCSGVWHSTSQPLCSPSRRQQYKIGIGPKVWIRLGLENQLEHLRLSRHVNSERMHSILQSAH